MSEASRRREFLDIHAFLIGIMYTAYQLKDKNPEELEEANKRLSNLEEGIKELEKEGKTNWGVPGYDYEISTRSLRDYLNLIKNEEYEECIDIVNKGCAKWSTAWNEIHARI